MPSRSIKEDKPDPRSEDEKTLYKLIEKGNDDGAIAHIKASSVKIDCVDSKGMTPLQLAAFRGNKVLCEFLLARGADVNHSQHDDSYSALMFAALSGKVDVTRLMLEAGANPDHINTVNRTAAQMAAFVGQHQCVSAINNFFPFSQMEYFTKPQGLEKEAKLPLSVAPALCSLINFSNIHPVKVSLYLSEHPELLSNSKKVLLVLTRLIERNATGRNINDLMAIKCHYIHVYIKMAAESREKTGDDSLAAWLKMLMKSREDGAFEFQERLIRQCLKDFPYANAALLQQLVRQIAPLKIGGETTAFQVLTSALNGQQYGWDAGDGCDTCWEAGAKAKCAKCQMVKYCNQRCQKLHWSSHKKQCARLAQEFLAEQEKLKKEEQEKKKAKEVEKKEKNDGEENEEDKKDDEEIVDKKIEVES